VQKLKQSITVETAFASYSATEIIGEGGAGRVFGATGPNGPVAIKLLTNSSLDKRQRFKNEIGFLIKNRHPHIVAVIDHGVGKFGSSSGPFYVMRRYESNLRDWMKTGPGVEAAVGLYSKILDGVEAAHLLGATHRDLKPENVLVDKATSSPAIADFGVASFTDELLVTLVETNPAQRLANFQYAAPEQRSPGRPVGLQADIYALSLMLNELFTGTVPHGTDYELIGRSHPQLAFLDAVVSRGLKQNPSDRFASVTELKNAIARHRAEFLSLQKISKIDETVIPAGQVDDPLAHVPPKIVSADWDAGTLTMMLDRPVHDPWVHALRNMGGHTSVMGIGPEAFRFQGTRATVGVGANDVQRVIDFFKDWLPRATMVLKTNLEQQARREEEQLREKLRRERQAEEERLKVTRNLRF
jgi:serine/threonine protein kinase